MFAAESVVIVGAGASHEAGLPTGEHLKYKIARSLDIRIKEIGTTPQSGDVSIYHALRGEACNRPQADDELHSLIKTARMISQAMPMAISIDNYIDAHVGDKNVELCGKLAIVQAILDAEKGSRLYFDTQKNKICFQHDKLVDTWYNEFMKLITENCRSVIL